MSHGLLLKPIKPSDWILGSLSPIQKKILNEPGDWRDFLPIEEKQKFGATETMACVSHSALNCLEILFKKVYGKEVNFSDRFTAWKSGTTREGNWLETVAESIRISGVCYEDDWTVPHGTFDWDKYYEKPSNASILFAWNLGKKYQFKHEWVYKDNFKEALTYGPVQVTVNAWYNKNGVYYNPDGSQNHAVVLIRYEGKNPVIFDSYAPHVKLLDKNYAFGGFGKQFSFFDIYKKTMLEIKNNWLYQLVEGPGSIALGLDGHLVVDDTAKILQAHIQRNRGDIINKQAELTLAEWKSIPKMNLKKQKL